MNEVRFAKHITNSGHKWITDDERPETGHFVNPLPVVSK